MALKLRIASFNVQNLFSRPKVFNFHDKSKGDNWLAKIDEFQKILREENYTAIRKARLVELWNDEKVKDYVTVNEERGSKLFERSGYAVVGVLADGADDWDGSIAFKRAKFSDIARGNTAQVIKDTMADVMCIVEAEDRPTLRSFDGHALNNRFKYEMLLDGNDNRGIDVGLYSKYPLGGIWTHMFDRVGNSRIFSRDCPEYEVFLPNGENLYVLCNHLKSKGYDTDGTADERREKQAKEIVKILGAYDLKNELVVVAGDLNDYPTSKPLKPLMDVKNLHDVLELQFPTEPARRWTYEYENVFEQYDYVMVSEPLRDAFVKARVERKGMYKLEKMTSANPDIDTEKEYDTVKLWKDAASDHGAVCAEFSL
jgi:endonuclease/exonuclease/phosphatase family metal-dependent hydrolase